MVGFQPGRCLLCDKLITPGDEVAVDHVFPHSLMSRGFPLGWFGLDLDQVWTSRLLTRSVTTREPPLPTPAHVRRPPPHRAIMNSPTRCDASSSSHSSSAASGVDPRSGSRSSPEFLNARSYPIRRRCFLRLEELDRPGQGGYDDVGEIRGVESIAPPASAAGGGMGEGADHHAVLAQVCLVEMKPMCSVWDEDGFDPLRHRSPLRDDERRLQDRHGGSEVLLTVAKHRSGRSPLARPGWASRAQQPVDQREPIEDVERLAMDRMHELAIDIDARPPAEQAPERGGGAAHVRVAARRVLVGVVVALQPGSVVDLLIPRVEVDELLQGGVLGSAGFLTDHDDAQRPAVPPEVEAPSDVAHRAFSEVVVGATGGEAGGVVGADELAVGQQVLGDVAAKPANARPGGCRVYVDRGARCHGLSVPLAEGSGAPDAGTTGTPELDRGQVSADAGTVTGRVEQAVRAAVVPGELLKTPTGRAPFSVARYTSEGLVLLLGAEEAWTPLPWTALEQVPEFPRGRSWVRIGSTYSMDVRWRAPSTPT